MREVASNLSRPQHQDVISDPFPSSIDIFETNPDIISFEGGRIVIVRDLLWLWGMNYWLSQIFRNKGHLYLGTGYEIEILVSQLRLPPNPPSTPQKKSPNYPCSGKQCHTLFWIASYLYELDSLGPIKKSLCTEWSPKSLPFLLNCV